MQLQRHAQKERNLNETIGYLEKKLEASKLLFDKEKEH